MPISLSAHTIKGLAGDAAYGRGEVYFREGRVGKLEVSGTSILAEVSGTEIYQVHLRHTAKQFEGTCDCPASDNFDFCKHCVAASLAYLEQLEHRERGKSSEGEELLRHYLEGMDRSELADFVLDTLSRDRFLKEKWLLRAERAFGKLDAKTMKKRITRAIPYNRHLYRYAQVRQYFAQVDLVVDELEACAPELAPEDMLKLVDYAFSRMNRALETVDDSGGFRLDADEKLGQLHCNALAASEWDADRKAKYLSGVLLGDAIDLYPGVPADYLEMLPPEVIDAFYRLLQLRWDKLPQLKPESGDLHERNDWHLYLHLESALLSIARARGDRDAEIAYLSKTATSIPRCLHLSELCLQNQQQAAAWEWLHKGQSIAGNNNRDYRMDDLVDQEFRLLVHDSRFDEALELRWARFQVEPSMGNYDKLQQSAESAKNSVDWYRKTCSYLESLEDRNQYLTIARHSLLAEIHLRENQPQAALELAEHSPIQVDTLKKIALSNPEQSERVIPILLRLAESSINHTTNRGYRDAIELLCRAEAGLDKTGRTRLHRAIVSLGARYRVKRNFYKWLKEAFEHVEGL